MQNNPHEKEYQDLKDEANHWFSLHTEFPGNEFYWQQFMNAEMKCATYAEKHEKEIWKQ